MNEKKRRNRSPVRRERNLKAGDTRRTGMSASKSHSIWKKPRIQAMLKEPIGAPIHLTKEEARAIAHEAFGKRPDLPPGKEYVRKLRPIWKGLLKKRDG